jgi:hypothetical protein
VAGFIGIREGIPRIIGICKGMIKFISFYKGMAGMIGIREGAVGLYLVVIVLVTKIKYGMIRGDRDMRIKNKKGIILNDRKYKLIVDDQLLVL